MIPANVVQITTPKRCILDGLWFGPKKPETLFIFVHGLAGSLFGETEKKFAKALARSGAAVLLFNNRGHDIISKVYREALHTRKHFVRIVSGAAHEVFTDCVDDIDGAVAFAERSGVKRIVLIGHSTGCQKSIYWASKRGSAHSKVKAIALLAPVSDRAAYLKEMGEKRVRKAEIFARSLLRSKKSDSFLPYDVWPHKADAQRVISLVADDSEEEIFLYAQPHRTPKTLQRVNIPILVVWAERDEYGDQPAKQVAAWFQKSIRSPHTVVVIPHAGHSFRGSEQTVAKAVLGFMKE